MKKIFFSLLLIICAINIAQAQTPQVKVTLKNGVVVKGDLKEFNPSEYVVVKIAGLETKILMEKIASIENLSSNLNEQKRVESFFDTNKIGNYEITDQNQYPESFELKLEGQTLKMILVRGGRFVMGYDGDGSLRMKSEPVHQVTISSYYISKTCINDKTAYSFLGKDKKSKDISYSCRWKDANQVVEKIANKTHKPYRLLTEAEWEYASLMPFADEVWGTEEYLEWCSDFVAEYSQEAQTNPQGPISGKRHVCRSYRGGKNKWDRRNIRGGNFFDAADFRIAISADAINK